MGSVQSKISEILIVRTELVAELKGLEEAIRDGLQRDAMLMLIDKYVVARGGERLPTPSIADSDDVRTFQALMPLLIEERLLSLELGPRHPKMRAIRQRIETTRTHLKQLQELVPDQVVEEEGPKTDFLAIYLDSLRQEIKLTVEKENQLLKKKIFLLED